ncbi:MAG: AmfC protein [Frankiales bacterium]|nr:AmfC protein [Frankiales bacterium]
MTAEDTPVKGTRRIDRVLAEDFLAGLGDAPLEDVRALRGEAEQEEVDLSYLRRLIQGRLDVLRAELNRREGSGKNLVEDLAGILADEPRSPARGLGRHSALEPSRVDSHRRYVEALVADVDLSDVSARTPDDLAHAMRVLSEEEQKLSAKRRDVQQVMDACSAEITRRYRDGEADVSALLSEGPA